MNLVIYNDDVQLELPVYDNGRMVKNEYGEILRTSVHSVAHVRNKLENYYTEDGEGRTSKAQIYIPFDSVTKGFDDNARVITSTPNGTKETQSVKRIEYGQSVTGKTSFIKVYL